MQQRRNPRQGGKALARCQTRQGPGPSPISVGVSLLPRLRTERRIRPAAGSPAGGPAGGGGPARMSTCYVAFSLARAGAPQRFSCLRSSCVSLDPEPQWNPCNDLSSHERTGVRARAICGKLPRHLQPCPGCHAKYSFGSSKYSLAISQPILGPRLPLACRPAPSWSQPVDLQIERGRLFFLLITSISTRNGLAWFGYGQMSPRP
jgi:hypothetical protein